VSPRRTAVEAQETRETVLDAAIGVARRSGGRFTVDAVAREAGVSKGAVLHHFRSKEALAAGMLERELNVFEALLDRKLAEEPADEPGRWLRAYVKASFEAGPGDAGVNEALMAALATDPGLLEPFEGRFSAEDGLGAARAAVVRHAVDGLVTAEIFGLGAPEGAEREALMRELIGLTRGTSR
jgi:AcrR family transcriptional regulator